MFGELTFTSGPRQQAWKESPPDRNFDSFVTTKPAPAVHSRCAMTTIAATLPIPGRDSYVELFQ